jgi:hypothetical protein
VSLSQGTTTDDDVDLIDFNSPGTAPTTVVRSTESCTLESLDIFLNIGNGNVSKYFQPRRIKNVVITHPLSATTTEAVTICVAHIFYSALQRYGVVEDLSDAILQFEEALHNVRKYTDLPKYPMQQQILFATFVDAVADNFGALADRLMTLQYNDHMKVSGQRAVLYFRLPHEVEGRLMQVLSDKYNLDSVGLAHSLVTTEHSRRQTMSPRLLQEMQEDSKGSTVQDATQNDSGATQYEILSQKTEGAVPRATHDLNGISAHAKSISKLAGWSERQFSESELEFVSDGANMNSTFQVPSDPTRPTLSEGEKPTPTKATSKKVRVETVKENEDGMADSDEQLLASLRARLKALDVASALDRAAEKPSTNDGVSPNDAEKHLMRGLDDTILTSSGFDSIGRDKGDDKPPFESDVTNITDASLTHHMRPGDLFRLKHNLPPADDIPIPGKTAAKTPLRPPPMTSGLDPWDTTRSRQKSIGDPSTARRIVNGYLLKSDPLDSTPLASSFTRHGANGATAGDTEATTAAPPTHLPFVAGPPRMLPSGTPRDIGGPPFGGPSYGPPTSTPPGGPPSSGRGPPSSGEGPPSTPPFKMSDDLPPKTPPPTYLTGFDWREHRVNPDEIETVLDVNQQTIVPWMFTRTTTGNYVNHGVRFKIYVVPRDTYMANFQGPRRLGVETGSTKNFLSAFPVLPNSATPAQILAWSNSASQFCAGFGVYLPPTHTLWANDNYGRWGGYLPEIYRPFVPFYDNMILQALRAKNTNLSNTPALVPLLALENEGMRLYHAIVRAAGHPALTYGRLEVGIPRQKSTMSMVDYLSKWMYYLHLNYLRGTFLSDRYFLESFADNLNMTYGNTLRPHLHMLIQQQPLDMPVTENLHPENLLSFLTYISNQVGIQRLDLMATPMQSDTTRRSSSNKNVRAIEKAQHDHEEQTSKDSLVRQVQALDFLDDDDLQFVLQVVASGPRKCDICQSEDHLISSCPEMIKIKDDPYRLRRMLGALRAANGEPPRTSHRNSRPPQRNSSSNRSGTPTRSNRNTTQRDRVVAQTVEEYDTDEETVVEPPLADDVDTDTDTDTDGESDFR